jgi:hypothetical protein
MERLSQGFIGTTIAASTSKVASLTPAPRQLGVVSNEQYLKAVLLVTVDLAGTTFAERNSLIQRSRTAHSEALRLSGPVSAIVALKGEILLSLISTG